MCTAMQRFTNITRQRTDISTFTAYHAYFYLRQITFQQFDFIYYQSLRFQLYIIAFTCQFVSAFAVYLTSRKGGRNLFYRPYKPLQCFFYQFPGNVFRRIGGIDFLFQIIRRGCSAQLQRSHIFLGMILELLNPFCRFPCADNHHSCSQRVERSRMSYLYLFHT